ncbi:hypothetical protein AN958_01091 [Leucoagaricus sp. SymC.cos]|nr:hypothetical protein AN958_01091 [Leucoagaricus sp. SymC.cos]
MERNPLNQYQHYVPRFILRGFQDAPVKPPPTTTSRKKKGKQSTQKQQLSPESIRRYDLASGEYEPNALISQSYGFSNLYRDAANTANINHVEEKFAKLESSTASVIQTLKNKVSSGEPSVDLIRKDLYILRKFLFLLHIRSREMSKTYFQEDHPQNARLREWIQRQKAIHNLSSDMHLWLHGLEYYLDTPTDRILSDSQPLKDSQAFSQMVENLSNPSSSVDPDTDIKYCHAQAYELFHSWFYMAICKAAPDQEFVLGHNSFGIWEGTLAGEDGEVHRLYILSPKIAIILRLNMTKDPMFSMMMVGSILHDIPFSPPVTHYVAPPKFTPNDTFAFRVHQLTESQTYRVNEIVLENVHADGTLTFASEEIMLTLLTEYDSPNGSFSKPRRSALRNLKDALSQSIQSRGPPDNKCGPSGTGSTTTYPSSPRALKKESPSNVPQKTMDGLAARKDGLDAVQAVGRVDSEDVGPESGSSLPPAESEGLTSAGEGPEPSAPHGWTVEELPSEPEDIAYNGEYNNRIRESPPFPSYIYSVPIVERESHDPLSHSDFGNKQERPEALPLSWTDDVFDTIFKESLATWERIGRRIDPALLRRVYLAVGTSDKDNHPIALKIRCMISDTVRRRTTAGTVNEVHLYPWVVPQAKLDDFLTEAEFITVFHIATTMALQDEMIKFKPESVQWDHHSPSRSTLTFVQQVAVYGYLRDWLYRHELLRLLTVTAIGVQGFMKKLRANMKLSTYFYVGACHWIQGVYCTFRFAGRDRYRMSAMVLALTSSRAWYQAPDVHIPSALFQLYELAFVKKVVWFILYSFFSLLVLSCFWSAFMARRQRHT